MKKLLILLTVAALALSMVACGNDPAPSQDPSSDVSSSEPSEPSSPESTPEETKTIQGVIEEGTTNTVTIKAEDGKSYTFSLTDETDKTKVNGLTVGDTLIVTYTGEIAEDGSTDGVTVTALEQLPAPAGDGSSPAADPSSEPSSALLPESGSQDGSSNVLPDADSEGGSSAQ